MNFIFPNEIFCQVSMTFFSSKRVQIFSYLRKRDLKGCCSVCTRWNEIIVGTSLLYQRKTNLDPYDTIKVKHIIGSRGGLEGEFRKPFGVCIDWNGNLLVSDVINDRIQVFDRQYQPIYSIRLDQNYYVLGIHVFESRLFITDFLQERVEIYNSDYVLQKSIEVVDFQPKWIYCSKRGNILVTGTGNYILMLDCDGHVVKRIETKGECVQGICVNSKDEIILVIDSMIKISDSNGNPLRCFSIQGCGSRGICVDQQDNIFVCNSWAKDISIFSPDGNLIQQVGLDYQPVAITVCDKEIFISSISDSIIVLSNSFE